MVTTDTVRYQLFVCMRGGCCDVGLVSDFKAAHLTTRYLPKSHLTESGINMVALIAIPDSFLERNKAKPSLVQIEALEP